MERKKQFQLQTLTAKINTYTTTLQQLLQQRNTILATIEHTNANTNANINNNENNLSNENTELLSQKQKIEQQIKDIKQLINSSKYEIINITNQIKLLPENLQQALNNEINIYNDALDNINNIITDEHIKYQENISIAILDKQTLLDNIITTQQEINQTTDNITTLQTTAHNSRKNILLELHQQKQQKLDLQQQITNINNQNTIYNTHLEQLYQINNILAQLKIAIVNQHYNTPSRNNDTTTITDLLNQLTNPVANPVANPIDNQIINIDLEKLVLPEYINTITGTIDDIIKNNTARITTIIAKAERALIKNNKHIENIISNNRNNSGNNSSSTRNKTVRFKDQYKTEKNKRTELQTILADLQYQYDNYNTLVINKLLDRHNNTLLELETHKQEAKERLQIMQERITTEHKQKLITLETQLQTMQNNIANYNQKLQQFNSECTAICNRITELDKSTIELQELDTKIIQLENTIEKIQNDKNILEQQ